MLVDVHRIRIDSQTQPRAALNQDTIVEMIDDLKAGDVLPPVVLYQDGADYWLADGWHRVVAHRQEGKAVIEAEVVIGTARDAFLAALRHNKGTPLTVNDRKRAALRLLKDTEWSKWSDREIGRRCGISHQTVATIKSSSGHRDQMSQEAEMNNTAGSHEQKTDQNQTQIKKAGPGGETGDKTRDVATILAGNPNMTNAAIAKQAGCHETLVGRIRKRGTESNEPQKTKATRNGKTYEIKTKRLTKKGQRTGVPKRLSVKAWDIMKNSAPAADPTQKRQLSALNRSMQIQVAKRLRDGESNTVKDAVDQILRGAPVTVWEKAYAAICELDPDDRVRLCRMVLSENERPLAAVK